ncbi:unnamed protein product, partial [Cylicocyclus nassatus]
VRLWPFHTDGRHSPRLKNRTCCILLHNFIHTKNVRTPTFTIRRYDSIIYVF